LLYNTRQEPVEFLLANAQRLFQPML
jgi:hypothetical protein